MDIIDHVAATSDLLSHGFTAARAVPGPLACPIAAALGPLACCSRSARPRTCLNLT